MARGDFPRRRCKAILVAWFKTNRSDHEDSSPQPRDCVHNGYSHRYDRDGQIVCCADKWHVDQGDGTSLDDGRALSGAAGTSPPFVMGLSQRFFVLGLSRI